MSNQKKSKQLAIDTILFGISTFGSKILVFLLTPLYTAVLSTQEYGTADLINTTVNLIYPLLTLAISEATLRYALDKNCSTKAVFGNSIVITVLSIFLLIGFYPVIAQNNSEIAIQLSGYWWYFIATYAVYNIHLCFSNFIKGLEKTKLFAIQGIVQTVTVILCNIVFLLFFKMGLRGYLLSIIISFFVSSVLMFFAGKIYCHAFPLRLEKKLFSEMLRYSVPMIPILLAWSINLYINKYMLIGLLPSGEGIGQSGIFSVANKIPSLLTAVLAVFLQAWQISAISNVDDEDASEYQTQIYNKLHLVALFCCIIIIPFSKLISMILFDPSYYSAWQHMPFLTLSAFFSCLSGFLAAAFRAHKKTAQLFTSVVLGAVANIVLNLVLIPFLGAFGSAVAMTASFLITWIVRMFSVQSLVRLKINIVKTVTVYALAVLACTLISFEVAGAYLFYVLFFVICTVLYYGEIKEMFSLLLRVARKFLKRT